MNRKNQQLAKDRRVADAKSKLNNEIFNEEMAVRAGKMKLRGLELQNKVKLAKETKNSDTSWAEQFSRRNQRIFRVAKLDI